MKNMSLTMKLSPLTHDLVIRDGKICIPSLSSILPQLAGQTVHLAPFLLTAGHHADRELTQWKETLEQAGCTVTMHTTSLAHNVTIRKIFVKHLAKCVTKGAP